MNALLEVQSCHKNGQVAKSPIQIKTGLVSCWRSSQRLQTRVEWSFADFTSSSSAAAENFKLPSCLLTYDTTYMQFQKFHRQYGQ